MSWRPIKTAPKEEPVLLLYQGHDHLPFVCQGAWVQSPHENRWLASLRGELKLDDDDFKGHWEAGYIATYDSGYGRLHWKATSFLVFPTHWQPLPKPPRKLPRGYQAP